MMDHFRPRLYQFDFTIGFMIDVFKQLKTIPERPGVYLILDSNGKVIYIDRAKNIKERIRSHLVNKTSNRNKMIAKHMRSVEYEVIETPIDATRRELELIQEHYPALNGPKKGMKQYRFVKVYSEEQFPRARKKKFIEEGDNIMLGPFPKSHHIQIVLSVAANHYKIADCGKEIVFGDDHKIVRTCIRRQTDQCLKPCEVEVDQSTYQAALNGFISFFQGDDTELIEKLNLDMKMAVNHQKYELAAKLRDELSAIKRIGLGID